MTAEALKACMKPSSWLPFIAVAVLVVTPLPAQQNLPKSTQEGLAASVRVEVLTPSISRPFSLKPNQATARPSICWASSTKEAY